MKTAAAAFAAAALFLAAVVMGIGQSAPSGEPNLPAIEVRQDEPDPTPTSTPEDDTEKVERNVDDGKVGDYDDRGRGRGGDDGGHGEDKSGHGRGGDDGGHGGDEGQDNSGHGGGGDDSGDGGSGSGSSGGGDDSSGGDR
jgi:hypothetical protein